MADLILKRNVINYYLIEQFLLVYEVDMLKLIEECDVG